MARLLKKHLGIGVKKSSSAPNAPKLDVETPPPPPRPGPVNDASETDSSSTVSSAATAGSNDEFPPPPGAWTLQQILGEATGASSGGGAQAFGGARPKDTKGQHHCNQHYPSENVADRWNCLDPASETAESDFVVLPKKLGKVWLFCQPWRISVDTFIRIVELLKLLFLVCLNCLIASILQSCINYSVSLELMTYDIKELMMLWSVKGNAGNVWAF